MVSKVTTNISVNFIFKATIFLALTSALLGQSLLYPNYIQNCQFQNNAAPSTAADYTYSSAVQKSLLNWKVVSATRNWRLRRTYRTSISWNRIWFLAMGPSPRAASKESIEYLTWALPYPLGTMYLLFQMHVTMSPVQCGSTNGSVLVSSNKESYTIVVSQEEVVVKCAIFAVNSNQTSTFFHFQVPPASCNGVQFTNVRAIPYDYWTLLLQEGTRITYCLPYDFDYRVIPASPIGLIPNGNFTNSIFPAKLNTFKSLTLNQNVAIQYWKGYAGCCARRGARKNYALNQVWFLSFYDSTIFIDGYIVKTFPLPINLSFIKMSLAIDIGRLNCAPNFQQSILEVSTSQEAFYFWTSKFGLFNRCAILTVPTNATQMNIYFNAPSKCPAGIEMANVYGIAIANRAAATISSAGELSTCLGAGKLPL